MSYLFTCPHCQTQTRVTDEFSGQTGQCVTCGRQIQLPNFAQQPTTSASPPARNIAWVRWLVAGTFVVALLLTVGLIGVRYAQQGVQQMRTNRQRGLCRQNLEKIAAALNNYAQDYGSYPPPTTFAADGTAMHSWRVLILPYLGYQSLYDSYRLDKPWDSEINQAIAFRMPTEYSSPGAPPGFASSCSYFLITGPGTLFPSSGPLGPDDVTDNPQQTLLLVESTTPPLNSLQWLEPGDFKLGSLTFNIGSDIGGNHTGGMTIATVAGNGHWVPDTTKAATLRALISPQGNEGIQDDTLQ